MKLCNGHDKMLKTWLTTQSMFVAKNQIINSYPIVYLFDWFLLKFSLFYLLLSSNSNVVKMCLTLLISFKKPNFYFFSSGACVYYHTAEPPI